MTDYLDTATSLDTYKALSALPSEYVDEVEGRYPGHIEAQAKYWSAFIDARLAKRYVTPFAAQPNTPWAVTGWLARLLDVRVLIKRGVDQTDEQFTTLARSADSVQSELAEAADAVKGLFDLPLLANSPGSGLKYPKPLSNSEVSPYTWSRLQRENADGE